MTTRAHTPFTVKPGTKGLTLTAAAVLVGALGLSGCGSSAPGPGHADQLALTELTNLTTNNPAATTDFSPAMAQTLPAPALAQQWARYQNLLGNYQTHGQPQDLTQGELTVVNLPLNMARTPGQLRITVDHDGHIAGLFFLDATTPFVVHPASESTPLPAAGSPATAGSAGSVQPAVVLSAPQVQLGHQYSLSAAGFAPGETVTFSWTGPTSGVIGTASAGPDGNAAMPNPIIEKDPPGTYTITATGTDPANTATADLHVIPDPGHG